MNLPCLRGTSRDPLDGAMHDVYADSRTPIVSKRQGCFQEPNGRSFPGSNRQPARSWRASWARTGAYLLACAAIVFVLLISTTPAHAVEHHFRASPPNAASLTLPLLSDDDRAFLAALPEVRVAIPLPPASPYERIDQDGLVTGIHPEMLVALSRAFGFRVRPVIYESWSAVLAAARARDVDMVMTLGVTADRLEYLEFTLGTTPLTGTLFTRSGASPTPIETATFVLEKDYMANEFVRRQYPNAKIVTVPTTGDALRAVVEGRGDYYLGSLLEATDWLEVSPVPGIVASRLLPYGTGYYHFGVRKDWAPLARILNKGIQALRQQPNRDIDAALSSLSPLLRPERGLALSADAVQVIVQHPLWRVGAVRGLAMLNDVDAHNVHSGIAAEYTEQIARRLGIAVQVVSFDNVASMLEALRQGRIDLVPFLTRTVSREKEFGFSAPYLELPYMLVARSDAPLYWSMDSMRGRRLALALAHPLRDVLSRDYPDITVVDAANGNEAMDKVARGEADAAVEVKLFANLRVNSDPTGELRVVTEVRELPAQFHFATRRDAQDFLPLVNQALADIPEAERQRMLRRWVAVDLQPPFPWRRHLPLAIAIFVGIASIVIMTAWWNLRLRREVVARRRSEMLLADVATVVPAVAFRYVFDLGGRLRHVFISPSARDFLGIELRPTTTLWRSMAPHMSQEDRDLSLARAQECEKTGERYKCTVQFQPPGLPARWIHSEAVMTHDPRGRKVWTGYLADVSTERELLARLSREASARNLLLAAASHELRAPTHNLSLALQSIDTATLPADSVTSLRIARRAASTLTNLLNDVLDAARFDAGPLKLHPAPFDLRELVEEVAESWGHVARAKGLVFSHSLVDEAPSTIVLDALRIKQILTNLLSNACKYTSRGSVSLAVGVDLDEGLLHLVVEDTGPGFDAQARAQLFQPFATLSPASPPSDALGAVASSGLGLMVCRKIAVAMGGRIDVTSKPGEGSTFSVVLPLSVAGRGQGSNTDLCATTADNSAPSTYPLEPSEAAQIIVCDDDPVSRLLTSQILRMRGYDVIEAADAPSALAAWRDGLARALVTDLSMPGMDGRALIRELRAQERIQCVAEPTCVIICSGEPPADDVQCQHDAYLLKPVDMMQLSSLLIERGILPAADRLRLAGRTDS